MFEITINEDQSLEGLAALHAQGHSVLRSAHVGNQYASNLAVYHKGIRGVLYDRMTPAKDENYHPYLCCFASGQSVVLGEPTQHIVARTVFPANHMQVLRRVFPDTHFETHTDYFMRHQGRVEPLAVLKLFTERLAGKHWKWHRFVNREGLIEERKTPRSWQQIVEDGIFGVNADTYGWIPPNIFNVLFYGLYESLEYETNILHHLSGPDMYGYVMRFNEDLNEMWPEVVKYVGVPADIEFRVYPTAFARFAITPNKRRQLDDLMTAWHNRQNHEAEKGRRIQAAAEAERLALVSHLGAQTKNHNAKMADAMAMCPEVFSPLGQRRHVTQHDADKSGIYFHPFNGSLTFRELREAAATMQRYAKRARKRAA